MQLAHLQIINGYANETEEDDKGTGLYNNGSINLYDINLSNNLSDEEGTALLNKDSMKVIDSLVLTSNGSFYSSIARRQGCI